MTTFERLLYGTLFGALTMLKRMLPPRLEPQVARVATLIARQFPWWNPVRDTGQYNDITEVIEQVNVECDPSRWGAQRGSRLGNELLRRIFP